jgi:hypothetical protein
MTARSPDTLTRSMAELTAEGSPEKRARVSQQVGSSSPPMPLVRTPVTQSQQPVGSGQPLTPNTGSTQEAFVPLSGKQWRALTGNWATLQQLLAGQLPDCRRVGLYEHHMGGIAARVRAYLDLPFPFR